MSTLKLPGLDLSLQTIFCIGRNYAEHARELGNKIPDEPLVFLKPAGSASFDGDTLDLPLHSNNVHFEGEIVCAIGKKARNISAETAMNYIAGMAAGIDFTDRELQDKLKAEGKPWTLAKGQQGFAAMGNFIPTHELPELNTVDIQVRVNDKIRQKGNSADMLFPISELISFLSKVCTLWPGDIIYTGTPSGVGRITSGDRINTAILNGRSSLNIDVN